MAQKVVGRLSHPPTNWLIRRYIFLASPAAWPDLSVTLSAMVSFALPVWRASGFVPLASTIGGFFSNRRAGIVARYLRTVGYGA
jgi:hypothetical protein